MSKIYSNFNLKSRKSSGSRGFVRRNKFKQKRSRSSNSLFNFSKFFNFIDRFGNLNSFYFQIIGISMLTLAIILTFFSIFNFTTTQTSASDGNENVKILTNFQGDEYTRSSNPKLVEITPPQVEPVEPVKEPEYYVVKPGDSLFSISAELGIDINLLIELNDLEDPRNLVVDQKLLIS